MTQKRLSDSIADDIISMIVIEKRFQPGDKLPNENELSEELNISRTTLREAIRILVTNGIVEIKRGRGTFIKEALDIDHMQHFGLLTDAKINAKDLYEMRLIFEPEAAYYATIRASDQEMKRIIDYGLQIEEKIKKSKIERLKSRNFINQSLKRRIMNLWKSSCLSFIKPSIKV